MMIFRPVGLLGRKEFSLHKVFDIITGSDKRKFLRAKGDEHE